MNEEDNGWFLDLMQVFPELPGIVLLLFGIIIWYWSIKENEWMFDTGGPRVFTNIAWIRSTFGEAIARRFNAILSWGIILLGILFILIGLWVRTIL